jgi:hypothetical protein
MSASSTRWTASFKVHRRVESRQSAIVQAAK